MIDSRSQSNIDSLKPEVQPIAINFLEQATVNLVARGYHCVIIQGTRTFDQQNALYAEGRSAPGKIVTNAPGGYSLHNFGIAFDIGIFDLQGRYVDSYMSDDACDALYESVAPIGKSFGLEWGGDWKSITDFPHYQYNPSHLSMQQMRQRVTNNLSLFA